MKIEPPADMRSWAVMQHQMFVAMIDAGFTEEQALSYLAQMFAYRMHLGEEEEGS